MSKKIKLSNLIPDAKNHNRHTREGMALIEKSVERVGIIESITISNDNEIISGNARHEIIGRKFESEPIVVETDGTRPVIIKRTDINSGTKQFYEASILANTTAKKNIDIDFDVIEVLEDEYGIDAQDLGVEIMYIEDKEHNKTVQEPSNMIAVTLTDDESEIWLHTKEKLGKMKDKNAVFALIKLYSNETNID